MSDEFDDSDEMAIPVGTVPGSVDDELAVPAAAAVGFGGSYIDDLQAEIDEVAGVETRDLRVGKISTLYARYRQLDDDERAEVRRHGQNRKMRRGEDRAAELTREQSALLLVKSCEMLLTPGDDGRLVPLHEHLNAAGADIAGPLVYNAETVEVLQLGAALKLSDRPSSVEIVTALHRWGRSHSPLMSTARLLDLWMQGIDIQAVEETLKGL